MSLDEIKERTGNFGPKALIGEGSYGRVYYADLSNGRAVAVKKLDVSVEGSSDDFLTQVRFADIIHIFSDHEVFILTSNMCRGDHLLISNSFCYFFLGRFPLCQN